MGHLPDSLTDEIWASLCQVYGTRFTRQYEGLAMGAVKYDWARRLGRYMVVVDNTITIPAIDWALDPTNNMLPPQPPNAIEFTALCKAYLQPNHAKLPPPTGRREIPSNVRAEMERIEAEASKDKRPERVKVAARYVDLWGHVDQLNPMQRGELARCRLVLERWDASEVERIEKEREWAQQESLHGGA